MSEFTLSLRDLPEGESTHRFELRVEWLRDAFAGCEDLAVGDTPGMAAIKTTRNGKQVLVQGNISASLRLTCVRCLREYDHPVESSLEVLMQPAGSERRVPKKKEATLEDLGIETYDGETLVFDEVFREMTLLEVPMNPSCGADCPGWGQLLAEASEGGVATETRAGSRPVEKE